MDLTNEERALLLAGLHELSTTHAKDDAERAEITALVRRLGGDDTVVVFAAPLDDDTVALLEQLPELDDEPTGIYYPHATHGDETEPKLALLLADCITSGAHHLVTLDHPAEGMVVGCSHCHRYWRTD